MRVIDDELYRAINLRRTEEVRFLLDRGADARALGNEDRSTLLLAARRGEEDDTVCRLLIEAGADVNAGNKYESVLYWAVQNNRVELARDLIALGARVTPDDGTRNPMHGLREDSQLPIAKLLIEHGGNPKLGAYSDTILSQIAGFDSAELCKLFLDSEMLDVADCPEALLRAAEQGRLEVARVLVAHGAKPSWAPQDAGSDYLTPFQAAVKAGHVDMVSLFLDACGEDPAQRAISGKTMAQLTKSKEVRDILKAAKAEASVRGAVGSVPEPRASKSANTRLEAAL